MNPADEEAAELVPTEGQSPGAVVGSHDNLEEQIHNLEEQLHDVTLKDLQRTNHQSKPAEDLHGFDEKFDEELRVSVDALLHPSPSLKPELDDLLSTISHRLDDEASERKKIYNRLLAIQSEMERLASRGFTRYLVALCIGVAVILAWQSYGEAAKQIIATRAPELGWSPEAKQMIASWVQQLAKPPVAESTATPVARTALENVAPKAPAAPSINPEQVQQMARDLAALRQTVEQLAASQDEMVRETAREMARLESSLVNILLKIPESPPQRRGRR
jgi:hypothetical protein